MRASRSASIAPTSPGPGIEPARGPQPCGGPSPWLVLGAAFAVGVLAAKTIDWRGNAHP